MAERYNGRVGPSEKKGNRTVWILLFVAAALVLCSCCVIILAGVIASVISFTSDTYYFIPLLPSIV